MSPNGQHDRAEAGTVGAVIVAGLANVGIAVAKLVAGLLSGSAAMLSESAHSFADTITEVLLYAGMRQSAGPADVRHPLGRGRIVFVWALFAAVATFTLGGGFAITHGIHAMSDPNPPDDIALGLIVLAISAVLEATSLRRSRRESRERARALHVEEIDYLTATSDSPLRAVVLEDVVALIGLALAAVGLLASAVTGSALWDGLGSILIGVLLLFAAYLLGSRNLSLLVGRPAPATLDDAMRATLAAVEGVVSVETLMSEATGPGRYLVLATVTFADRLDSSELGAVAATATRSLRDHHSFVDAVYLSPALPADG